MQTVDFNQILKWNREGIVPGPNETEEKFVERALYLQSFKEKIQDELGLSDAEEEETERILKEALPKAHLLFGIEPLFTPLFFSNEKLAPWHGGTSWIVQMEKDSPTAAFIQLKKCFFNNKRAFFYDREEIIAHELSHIGRMAFDCPLYEEIIAWSASKNWFRKFMGPLFISIKETSIFVFLLITLLMLDLMGLFLGSNTLFKQLLLLKAIPLSYLLYAGFRLWKRQKTYSKCLKNLYQLTQEEAVARAITYRLTDEEIVLFSKITAPEIGAYAEKSAARSLRWKTICLAYGIGRLSP